MVGNVSPIRYCYIARRSGHQGMSFIERLRPIDIEGIGQQGKIVDVVRRFAYVKETSYGMTFDVIAEPDPEHLAFTGAHLHHHTDMNYREKSPGMQLLHCLKVKLYLVS